MARNARTWQFRDSIEPVARPPRRGAGLPRIVLALTVFALLAKALLLIGVGRALLDLAALLWPIAAGAGAIAYLAFRIQVATARAPHPS